MIICEQRLFETMTYIFDNRFKHESWYLNNKRDTFSKFF